MADAGPSNSNSASSSHHAVTPPSSVSRASHIRFPQDHDPGSADSSKKSTMSQQVASLGLGRPPVSRRTTSRSSTHGDKNNTKHTTTDEARPRVKSVDAPMSSPGSSRARLGADLNINSARRPTPPSHRLTAARRTRTRGGMAEAEVEGDTSYISKIFSDEYDLANEDPRILEDVQHAMRLKARREARARRESTPERKVTAISDMASGSSVSPQVSPKRHTMPAPPPAPIFPPPRDNVEPEIDFSPSVGAAPLHPVPTSTNGGVTLDWTVPAYEDDKQDKRWRTLSIKRKPKEKSSMPSNREVIEKQDTLYSDKLAHIKAKIQPVTFRKAALIKDQLERQYSALLGGVSPRAGTPNLLNAARWYDSQDDAVKAALDRKEPLPWLKHLIDKSRRQPSTHLPWHVTTSILEEYLRIKPRSDAMETIPENGVVDNLALRPSPGSLDYPADKSPSSGSWSYTPSPNSIGPSLSRKRVISHDGKMSFEPAVDSGRESIGDDSRFSDNQMSSWKMPRTSGATSPRNSTQSSLFYANWTHGTSPNSSYINQLAHRFRRKPYGGSEDGLSSARNSISDHSQEEDHPASRTRHKAKNRPRHASLHILSRSAPPTDDEKLSNELLEAPAAHSDGEVPPTAKPPVTPHSSPAPAPPLKPAVSREASPHVRAVTPRLATKRVSLPSYNQFFIKQTQQRRQEADEDRERLEYDRKIQMLEDTLAQNHNTRQVLQRISHHMKEYDNVQNTLSKLMGVAQLSLPQDVLEAFNHDPSAVIGSTKRYKGWRAVEDIHDRITRQRQTISSFIASIPGDPTPLSTKNVFEDPISAILESLRELEGQRDEIAHEAETVAEALQCVKGIQSEVKREYNETLSHTSLIYPELSQIITLEENYRNHYQQLWNIGLDALTLLLDTVTPFWRNYGKVIGEDMQDFLVVPWYRNEFTGEPNWYPIKSFPKRSCRHWIGLVLFAVGTIVMTWLQLRAAVSSTHILSLPWLADIGVRWLVFPFLVVALVVQWSAVLFETFLIFAQAGIIIWWLGWSVRIFV